jgi:23S rRNA pseudouridine1911/1915/1917 synthase
MPRREISAGPDAAGARLDKYLAAALPDLTRSFLQRQIEDGRVTVDGRLTTGGSAKLRPGQIIVVDIPESPPPTLVPEDTPLDVVYEDQDLVVIDKPAGMVVHPAPGHAHGTLANLVIGRWEGPDGDETLRPGIVHRLDKDTSGLMVVAKNPSAQANLAEQMKRHEVVKRYLALIRGHLAPERGTIEGPIARDPRDRRRMAIVEGGREARTQYRVLEYVSAFTLVEATLETGRTHQIRVHFKSIGFPVVGDALYGVAHEREQLGRQFLHAYRLGFRLPSNGEFVEFASELPADLDEFLASVRG